MSKKQKSVRSAKLLKNVETALMSLGKARKHAKKLAKHEKRAIAALLEVEALVEDAKACGCKKSDKKKSAKKSKSQKLKNNINKNSFVGKHTSDDAVLVTAADIDEPLLSIKSLENTLDTPRGGQADELHLISGIGPKLEELLHGLGIFHFDQIANWTQAEIDWVDDYLQFSGRIERDNWIEQAKALAEGGRDEYVRVFGKEPR